MSTSLPPELVEQMGKGRVALFLGADLPQTVTGLPSRADLARGLAHRHGLDESLSLAEVAQRVSQAGNRWAFTDFIRNALDTAGKETQPFHRRIVEWVQEHKVETLITTAYDNLLELAFQQAGVALNRVVRGGDVSFINPDRPTLIKLYGDAGQPDTLVVTDRDHSDLLRDREREPLIDEVRRAMRLNTVLFIGYNLADPDFRFLFDQVAESRFARTAYAVWPGLPEADVRMWRDRGIVIVETEPFDMVTGAAAPAGSTGGAQAVIPVSSLGGGTDMDYERGLDALKQRAEGTDWYQDFAVHEAALRDNLRDERRYGPSEQTRRDRTRVVDQLNALALHRLGVSFNDLCIGKQPAVTPDPSRQADLEQLIRDAYGVIRECERTIQTGRPEEKLQARRTIQAQWDDIEKNLGEYRRLVGNNLPADIAQIAAHFSDKFEIDPLPEEQRESQEKVEKNRASTRKKVELVQIARMKQNYSIGDMTYRFRFSVIDSLYVGTPREKASSSYHTINGSITWKVLVNWHFFGNNSLTEPLSDEKEIGLQKVMFWYAKEYIEQRIKTGVLSSEESFSLSTDTAEDWCPFEISRIPDPNGFAFYVDVPEIKLEQSGDRRKGSSESGNILSSQSMLLGIGRHWAVLVGVNAYQDPYINPLSVCVDDVTAIHQTLAAHYQVSKLLTDATPDRLPTRANILGELAAVAQNAGEGDLLLFYFSGHGMAEGGESYLLARDTRLSALKHTAVAMRDVRELIEASPARAKVIVLDACHSGAQIGKAAAMMTPEFIRRVFEEAQGIAVLASCTQGQQSWEWKDKNRSVFTWYLLEALAGKADFDQKGFVTVADASRYVTDGVKAWAANEGVPQTPTLSYTVAGDIILLRYQK